METKSVWLITAKSNLHVGDESTSNYGIIDKSVQRDALTGLPCINSSSLKGALNEYFSVSANKKSDFMIKVFGVDKKAHDDRFKEEKRNTETQKGSYTFFDAQLLSIPVQSNNRLFYRATSIGVLEQFLDRINRFGITFQTFSKDNLEKLKELMKGEETSPVIFEKAKPNVFLGDFDKIRLQETNADIKVLEELLGTNIALFSDADFSELCDNNNLPIIARNKLDNGESKNLWYEQILPQETIFYSLFLSQGKEKLELDNEIVQIGANATIGYGYCEFKNLIPGNYEKA